MTPPPRDKVEPLRDIPGLPKKERTWRDEVQERVRKRRKKRTQSSLPLFEQPAVLATEPEPAVGGKVVAPPEPSAPEPESPVVAPPPEPTLSRETAAQIGTPDQDFEAAPLSEEELADLPLHPDDTPPEVGAGPEPEAPAVQVDLLSGRFAVDEEPIASGDDDTDAGISLTPPPPEPSPLERPARIGERTQAAAVDAGILCVLGALVVYFTGRTARVDVVSLTVSWPWMASYLAFLGLFYAGYFTGTSGQTPGKMVTGLRVVDARGRPPGYLRAVGRAAVAAVGTALAGLGLIPIALDPARRAFHDRLLHTRVVHR